MLDIIYGNNIYDFGLNFSNYNELTWTLRYILESKNTVLSSWYEKRADAVQQQYDKIYDAFIANSENKFLTAINLCYTSMYVWQWKIYSSSK